MRRLERGHGSGDTGWPIGSAPLGQGGNAVEDFIFTAAYHVDPRLGIVGIHKTLHGSRGLSMTGIGMGC